MANSLVIRKSTSLAKRDRALRAAQYVRMSTDYQRYSVHNQAAAIAAFARQRGFVIVRTYIDEGRSGLRIKGRPGLIELIDDVRSGNTDFGHILVYDVSRWGRFQDVDESAHYEFVCKENGINVAYCAEQFDNDGSLLSSIVKNIKRVMAAEFSRELSVKVHTGQCKIASLGYRSGGPVTFGLRRELVDESQRSKGELKRGERKSLQTDRVRLRLGSPEEASIVRWIFYQFVVEHRHDTEIAGQLNEAKILNWNGLRWSAIAVHRVLKNENYVGNLVYNITSRRLGQKLTKNSPDVWVRRNGVIDPIIEKDIFLRAQKIMAHRYVSLPDDQMLFRLRSLLKRKGRLTFRIIKSAEGVPSPSSFITRFGSLRNAYALVGYTSPRNCNWLDTREYWTEVLTRHATCVADALKASWTLRTLGNERAVSVTTDDDNRICFVTARQAKRGSNHRRYWRVWHRKSLSGLVVVLRLDQTNKEIEDYLILRPSKLSAPYTVFRDAAPQGVSRVKSLAGVIAKIQKYVAG